MAIFYASTPWVSCTKEADDVAELLVPFVASHGRADLSAGEIDRDYVEADIASWSLKLRQRSTSPLADPAAEDPT